MPERTVRLGLMPPLTGVVELYGAEIMRAGHVACQEINECGGVLGQPLELIVEDDGSLPESAVAAATRLVDHHGCTAIIGNLLSNSRIAVAYRVAEPRKIPYLNFSFYEGSILSHYFFHFAALPNQQIDRMIPHMREKFGPRMFFAGNNYEWPRGSIDAAKQALVRAGGEVTGEEYFPIGVDGPSIERLLDQIENLAPDVFVPYFAGADQVSLLTRFTARGLKNRIAVVMGHYDEMMASQLPPDVREGFYSSNTYFMSVDTPVNRGYLARLAKLPNVDGIWPLGNGILTNFGEGAYVCVKAFAQAANAAGSLDSEKLIGHLKTICVAAPQGTVRMDPTTHHATVNTYLARCTASGAFEIVDYFGAIAPTLPERYNHQRLSHQATLEEDIRLQARILEQMSEAVFLINTTDEAIVYTNGGADRMFGFNKGELIGQHFSLIDASSDSSSQANAAEIVRILNQKGSWQGDCQYKGKDGARLWCSTSISTFTHPVNGEVWMAVHRDITQLKLLQHELEQHRHHLKQLVRERTVELETAKDQAERANMAKSEFLARMSHELRTPMNAILGFAQVLALDNLGPDQKAYVGEILQAGDHLLKLINDLLELSRVEVGKLVAVVQPTPLVPIVMQVAQFIQSQLAVRQISLQNLCDSNANVLTDPTRLRQILINLLSNAVKFNRANGNIVIDCEMPSPGSIRVKVTDTGLGIAAEKLSRLFTPFERLGAEFSAIEGTGIGLALSKQLAELIGASIGVESTPGVGSTFWVELRLVDTHIDAADTARRKVLYVEDNPANLRVVEALFRHQPQLQLLSATNGVYGLELIQRYQPEIIILDIHLPGLNGYQVLEAMKMDPKTENIPVIALSADAMPIDVERGLRAGFCDYLTKPVNVDELVHAVERALKQSRIHR